MVNSHYLLGHPFQVVYIHFFVMAELPNRLAELNLTTNDACQYMQQLSTLGLKKLGKSPVIFFYKSMFEIWCEMVARC